MNLQLNHVQMVKFFKQTHNSPVYRGGQISTPGAQDKQISCPGFFFLQLPGQQVGSNENIFFGMYA